MIIDYYPSSEKRLSILDEYTPAQLEALTLEDLLGLYCGADIPASQPQFDCLMSRIIACAPKRTGTRRKRLYRGTSRETMAAHGTGHSWTNNLDQAIKFANFCVSFRYTNLFHTIDRRPIVIEHMFLPEEIICKGNRGEDEWIVHAPHPDLCTILLKGHNDNE